MSDATLSTVRNAARLLKAFLTREEELGVAELSRRLGLGKSSVHRLLTTLLGEGLVEQDARTGRYRLGIVMFELGEAVRLHMDLHGAAATVLLQLREETGESVQLGVAHGDDVIYVERLDSAHTLRLLGEPGRRAPLYCTSSGKVLLAFRSDPERADYLARVRLTPLTRHTITDPVQLRGELKTVRARGWAEAINERQVGTASLAAPVRDLNGSVVAALSVNASVSRFRGVPRRRLAQTVTEAAAAVSRRLGWAPEHAHRKES
ncbi:MAG: IclR family transcriptional regulator, regulon repressor [Pseudonocardiales bacterium]|jgi:DNA-binding IclR family transcriptional regulator|uniref:IclR family transcriptional regulator n=1 Tax=Pseudonocardia sp. Cha107L01 TaxID=3457576 RepID=UPI0028C5CCF9|nr:IclR family transcriptional regulator, regulon repressor [Pseudonocardiales bacterium]MDT7591244.1 IclR family transcriptional regulator, regulon repressor [Pseudonocardiales bacterium]MDT7598248.1 IclR family transcriptional regulator, regulon repressor [Pseudonocardiales bacterium]MDT7619428.1 IclR family transcriptional regulator, regulon repressor [Pseudonocardiales bacterium]MDT7638224.1 IclR family transcriptional regulator, regulon repressor [Pseudonocardiales bacterium]